MADVITKMFRCYYADQLPAQTPVIKVSDVDSHPKLLFTDEQILQLRDLIRAVVWIRDLQLSGMSDDSNVDIWTQLDHTYLSGQLEKAHFFINCLTGYLLQQGVKIQNFNWPRDGT